jgi:ankyrin repeat protein
MGRSAILGSLVVLACSLAGLQASAQADDLIKAAENGDLPHLEELLAKGVNVDARNSNGWTPLIIASEMGHIDVVQALLAKGSDINAKDNDGWTPLMRASQFGNLGVVRALLSKGADVNAKNYSGGVALIIASQNGHLEMVQALLSKGADVNAMDSYGWTALMEAAQFGHLDLVQALLAKGADVSAKSNSVGSALMLASSKGYIDVVQELLSKGADVNAKMGDGSTALLIASKNGHLDVVEALLAKGVEVNAKSNDGTTALSLASQQGHQDVVLALLSKGADINAPPAQPSVDTQGAARTAILKSGTICYLGDRGSSSLKCMRNNALTKAFNDITPRLHVIDGQGPKEYLGKGWKSRGLTDSFNGNNTSGFNVPITAGRHTIAVSFYERIGGRGATESDYADVEFVALAGHSYEVDAIGSGNAYTAPGLRGWIPIVSDITDKSNWQIVSAPQ